MNSCDGFSGAVLIALADGQAIYWNETAAAEFGWPRIAARSLAALGQTTVASEVPSEIQFEGSPGLDADAQLVKVIFRSGKTALLESRVMRLRDAAGGAGGYLYLLHRANSGAAARAESGDSATAKPGVSERKVLHQLNNVFASIHSSLDLALGVPEPAERGTFLQQAQESARRGAMIINELQLREMEVPGAAATNSGNVQPYAAGPAVAGDDALPVTLEGTERLLLAEDEKSMRALIRAVLAYRGYTVIEAVDGKEAVEKFVADGPFDLVLVDMELPKLVGPEVLRHIRAKNPAVRVLALSGSLFGAEERTLPPVNRFNGFLNKPFRNIELLKLVRRILDHPAAT